MILDNWAKQWKIPEIALFDLKQQMRTIVIEGSYKDDLSEVGVQSLIRIEATKKGCRLWRNNVGAAYMKDGSFLRYGLANDSAALNKQIKSADLIGIRPVVITASMIGSTIGQFISREVKSSKWRYTGNDREKAQLAWINLIISFGGDACFANSEGTL